MRGIIKEGDKVAVNFNGAQTTLCREAEVLNVPCQTGDSWILRDTASGEVHYISEGVTITLKPSKGAES